MLKKLTFGMWAAPLALAVGIAALVFAGCSTDSSFIDDNKLNQGLVGTWEDSGTNESGSWTDTYVIKANSGGGGGHQGTISHPEFGYENATIEFVYNFSETSGCLIIKYTDGDKDGRYSAVYFKYLKSDSVLLGDAYDVADYTIDVTVANLNEAKEKFAPANADKWGGGSKQIGTPQTKQ
jgi:hypothetical protein